MTKLPTRGAAAGRVSLRLQVMRAALDCSGGDLQTTFTAEDLLLAAWKRDPMAWGLRGHEREHPDSERIYTELDRASVAGKNVRGGLVGLGLLEKVRQRTYRLTLAGLKEASEITGAEPGAQGKAERALADSVRAILSHPVFGEWIKNPTMPKSFRDAGHFWGIASGTPPSVIRNRIREVETTLLAAQKLLEDGRSEAVSSSHGKLLFDRNDIARALEFQGVLRQRFARDLEVLQVGIA